MYETSLDKVLNYMKQYVENRFEHDSEPMLNYKDLELVLNYINKQKEVLDKIKEYCNNRLQYYNEMRIDYMREFDGYAENDIENILELLEGIE